MFDAKSFNLRNVDRFRATEQICTQTQFSSGSYEAKRANNLTSNLNVTFKKPNLQALPFCLSQLSFGS